MGMLIFITKNYEDHISTKQCMSDHSECNLIGFFMLINCVVMHASNCLFEATRHILVFHKSILNKNIVNVKSVTTFV